MAAKPSGAARVQVYLEPQIEEALKRDARLANEPLSKTTSRAIVRGMKKGSPADPDDRLLALERALRDHMRSSNRDLQIVQELLMAFARAFFERLPDTLADQDPTAQQAVQRRIERLYDEAASRMVRGRRAVEGDTAEPDPPEPLRKTG